MLWPHISQSILGVIWNVVPASIIGTFLEILVPGESQSLMSRLRGLFLWAVYIIIGVSCSAFFAFWFAQLRTRPLFYFDLSETVHSRNLPTLLFAYTVVPALGFLISDFFSYWFHRAEHTITHLWRVHSVHHSIEQLNAWNDYHHVLEDVIRFALVAVPMNLLINVRVSEVIVYSILLRYSGQITHANSKISFGPLRYVFVEPRFHRIHHSAEPHHWNKNFAFLFPIWDIIFCTAYFPSKDEYPRTGIESQREPRSVQEYLLAPFLQESANGRTANRR